MTEAGDMMPGRGRFLAAAAVTAATTAAAAAAAAATIPTRAVISAPVTAVLASEKCEGITRGAVMTAVCRSKVRNGVDADSAAAGDLQPGDRLTVLELGRNKAGQLRVRHAQGWSSFATAGSGRQLLRLQTLEAPGGGSGSGSAAAAVGLKRPAAADTTGGPSKRVHTAGAVSELAALRRREDQRREEPWGEEQRREEQRRNEQRQEVRRREAQRREAQ